MICKLAYNVIWHLLTSFLAAKCWSLGGDLAVPGQGVVRSRDAGGCFRLQSQEKKAVSLSVTATVSLGGKGWIHSIWFDSNFCQGQQSWLHFKGPNNYCTQMMPPMKRRRRHRARRNSWMTPPHNVWLMCWQDGWTDTSLPHQFLLWFSSFLKLSCHLKRLV